MIILLSPAKTLDFETTPKTKIHSQPELLTDSAELIESLAKLGPKKVSSLMGISDKLGQLNAERFGQWHTPFTPDNAKQAVLAFKGDVYTGLEAETFKADDFKFAQKHLRILSGLYGVLKPLDLIQPYRLEMGTAFKNARGKDLYQFWGEEITDTLNSSLKSLKADTVVNLASNEYFRSVQPKALNANIITPVFKDEKNGKYKIISFYAKKARGMMAAFIIKNRITDVKDLKKFKTAGYKFSKEESNDKELVFTRPEQ